MTLVALIAVVAAVFAGLIAKYALEKASLRSYFGSAYAISWAEFIAVSLLMALVITPTVLYVGKKLSVNNIVTYEQWLNGVERKPIDNVTTCYAGHAGSSRSAGQSNCYWSYDTGQSYSWTEMESQSYPCTGADGKASTCTRMVPVTYSADIYAPYATREHRYGIPKTFVFKDGKTFWFNGVYLDKNPTPYGGVAIPGNIPRGAPADWLDAKAHFDAGDPRPVTALDSYPNYIIASKDEVLNPYSNDIAQYKKAGLLPPHTAGIMSNPVRGASQSQADKVSFEGVNMPNKQAWQDAVMRFNAAFGIKLQGDLHVVLVDANRIPMQQAVPYVNAVKAYWQGPHFGKRALAKNGVILVLGVANSQVEWAETSTGMPFGNELMEQRIRDFLPGTALNPRAIFGSPRTVVTGKKATVTLSSPRGKFEHIVFEATPFKRASMSCSDDDENCVGYQDLLDTIEPTTAQKTWMIVVTTFVALFLWFLVGATSFVDSTVARVTGRQSDPSIRPFNSTRLYRNRGRRYF